MIKGYQKFSSSECVLSRVQLFATPETVAHQAPLSMGLSRQEYWSGLPFPSAGDPPDSGIKRESLVLAGGFFTTESPEKPRAGKKRKKKSCYGLHILRNCSGLLHSCLMILKWLRSWFGFRSWVGGFLWCYMYNLIPCSKTRNVAQDKGQNIGA